MKAFVYQGKLFIRAIPGKNLFKSTMVHEVVNRGDIFALCLDSQQLTVIPGGTVAEHIDIEIKLPVTEQPAPPSKTVKERLAAIKANLALKDIFV